MADAATPGAADLDGLYAAKLLNTSSSQRTFMRWVLAILAVVFLGMFLPWQQYVSGTGSVTAFRPQDRPQVVPSVIAGRIEQWFVQEGQYVTKGTPLLQISEVKDAYLDPRTLERYAEQVTGKEQAILAKLDKATALEQQIEALAEGLVLKLQQSENKVKQGEFLVQKDSAALEAAVLDSIIAIDQLRRSENLYKEGLTSLNGLQGFRLKSQSADAKVVEQRNDLLKARNELINAKIELGAVRAEYADKLAKARSDRAATLSDVQEGRAEVAKLKNSYQNFAARSGFYRIDAPQDGIVVKALRAGVGETIKEGEAVVTVQPARPEQAVELYVKAMDVPLLRPGRKVRLQFDGWPALQFAGWPSVMVGTFGGVIKVVDQVDSKGGKFRVLVVPDPAEEPWPKQLRMGSGVFGWAMLDTVRVWFEIWRQLNGFPPSIDPTDAEATGDVKAASAK